MKIATSEVEEALTEDGKSKAAVELRRKGGLAIDGGSGFGDGHAETC